MLPSFFSQNSRLLKIFTASGLVVIILISLAIIRENYQKKEVDEIIESLRQEAQKIERENGELAEKIAYLESQDYQEKEAKDKLNVQEAQEKVVIIKPGITPKTEAVVEENSERRLVVRVSNVEKWWDYFFKY